MNPITLTIRDKDSNLIETISGTFESADLDLLNQFVVAMARVRGTALLKRGMPAMTNMKWTPEGGMQFTCAPYEDSELFELLHVLRPFILSREVMSFEKVAALLGKNFASKQFSGHLRALRSMFEDGELKSYMQIVVGDQPLFDNSLLRLWLNGTQYHTDAEKASAWKEIEAALGVDNAKAIVMNQLHSKVKALFFLEHLVGLVRTKYACA
ncbi:MAG: hypothetical protein A3J49_16045 [Gallionellales bacterium RIFCSPHIGHO2_02_FULL_57_16]|nr:MAG: hypothetical protein A3J49_16045 [Gallionellales bacterium RIFCSPHIGHO2_02_FULL_57_16]